MTWPWVYHDFDSMSYRYSLLLQKTPLFLGYNIFMGNLDGDGNLHKSFLWHLNGCYGEGVVSLGQF